MDYSVNKELPLYHHVTRDMDILKYPVGDDYNPLYILELTDKIPDRCIHMVDGLERNIVTLSQRDSFGSDERVSRWLKDGNEQDFGYMWKRFNKICINQFNNHQRENDSSPQHADVLAIRTSVFNDILLTPFYFEFFQNNTLCGKTDFCQDKCLYKRLRTYCISTNECMAVYNVEEKMHGFWLNAYERYISKNNFWDRIVEGFYSHTYSIGDTYFVDTSVIANYNRLSNQLATDLDEAVSRLIKIMETSKEKGPQTTLDEGSSTNLSDILVENLRARFRGT